MWKIVIIITGMVITGEALALLIGMSFFNRQRLWFTLQNKIYIIADIITGIGMRCFGIFTISKIFYYAFVIAAVLTHGFRELEFFQNVPYKFCFNIPLFIVNNIKLIGLFLPIFG